MFIVLFIRGTSVSYAVVMIFANGEGFRNHIPLWKYLLISIPAVFATLCQYEALKYVTFSVFILGKSFGLIPSMLWSSFQGRHRKATEWLIVVIIALGVIVYLTTGPIAADPLSEHKYSYLPGFLFLVLFPILDSFQNYLHDRCFKDACHSANKYNRMFYENLVSCVVALVFLASTQTLVDSLKFCQRQTLFFSEVFYVSVAALCAEKFSQIQLKESGRAVKSATLNTRQVISICASYIVYRHMITVGQVAGLSAVFAALSFNNYHLLKSQREAYLSAESQPFKGKTFV